MLVAAHTASALIPGQHKKPWLRLETLSSPLSDSCCLRLLDDPGKYEGDVGDSIEDLVRSRAGYWLGYERLREKVGKAARKEVRPEAPARQPNSRT